MLVLAKNFNEESLQISGKTMRKVIQRTAQFGIHNFLALQTECTNNWNFHNSFFFAGTGESCDADVGVPRSFYFDKLAVVKKTLCKKNYFLAPNSIFLLLKGWENAKFIIGEGLSLSQLDCIIFVK